MKFAVRSVVRASFAGGLLALLMFDGAGSGRAQGPAWWDRAFGYRQRVTVAAGVDVPAEYAVSISFNHAALVSAGKSQADGDDVRVLHWDGTSWTELDRVLDEFSSWSSPSTEVWFKTRTSVSAGAADSNYYLHYGNAVAERPPADRSRVFDLWDDFNDTKSWTTFVDDGDRSNQKVSLQTDGKTVTVIPNGRLMSGLQHKTYSPGYTYGFAARVRAKSVGAVTDKIAPACWFVNAPSGETNCFESNGHENHYVRELGKSAAAGEEFKIDEDSATGPFPAADVWYTYQVERLATGRIRVQLEGRQQFPPNPGGFSKADTTLSSGGFGVGGQARSGECYQYDWIWARKRVDPEPGTTLGIEETPEPAPPPPPVSDWWNTCYTFRCRATVRTSGSAISAGHTVGITVDTAALIAAGKLRPDGKDLRVVYWNGTSFVELDRHITVGTFNTATTLVWFKAQAPIPAKSEDSNYFVHYGCSTPGEPPQDLTKVYNPPKDASTQVLWYAKDGTGRRLTDSSGRGRNRTLPSGWEWSTDSKFGTGFTTPLEETSKDGTGKRIGSGFSPNIDTEDWTVEGWVKITEQTPLYTDMVLWHTWRWGGFVMGTFGASEGQIFVSLNEIRDSVTTRKSLNRFHHFAASYDAANDKLYFYKDGVRVGQKSGLVSDTWGPTAFQIFYGGDGWSDFTYGALQEGIRVSSVRRESFPYVVAEEPRVLCGGEEQFDKTPPTITASIAPPPNSDGWNNTDVTVSFTCADDRSGIASCSPPVLLASEGEGQAVTGEAVDRAGNKSTTTVTVNIDKTLPSIAPITVPPPNENGWNRTDVTVSFDCKDALSGVKECSDAQVLSGEGAGQIASGVVRDRASNESRATASVSIDRTSPTISGTVSPPPNANGWNNTDVTVSYTCEDALSGVVDCPSAVSVSSEGESQGVTRSVTDRAGNTSSHAASVSIDKTPPALSFPRDLGGLVTRGPVTASVSVTEDHLGSLETFLNGAPFVNGGTVDVEGEYAFEARAKDLADNEASGSVEFAVDRTQPLISITGTPAGVVCGTVTPVIVVEDKHLKSVDVRLNGNPFAPGTKVAGDGSYVLEVNAEDKAENKDSRQSSFRIDCAAPSVTIDSPLDGFLTNQRELRVQGTVVDDSPPVQVEVSGQAGTVVGTSFRADVVLAEELNTLIARAKDAAGNLGESLPVKGRLDTTAPLLSLSGPPRGRRNQTVTVTASVSDGGSGVRSVQFSVDGTSGPELTSTPFETSFTIPGSKPVGSLISVVGVAKDVAGNASPPATHVVTVVAAGFLIGEVYDDRRGVTLPGVTISHGEDTVVSDLRGRFGFKTEDERAEVSFERAGYTGAVRKVSVDPEHGTVILDARLTPLDKNVTSLGADGGKALTSDGSLELTVPPGALGSTVELRLTELSPQGLPSPLPLGWSPVAAVQIDPQAVSFSIPSELEWKGGSVSGLSVTLVRFRREMGRWEVLASGLTEARGSIGSSGTFAFVVGDSVPTAPPVAEVGSTLKGATPVDVPFGLSAESDVVPSFSPVSPEAKARGRVAVFSPIPLPSGTVISAEVEETFDTTADGVLHPEPFTQELLVYRFPLRADGELEARFPVSPSRAFTAEELREGQIHVGMRLTPSFVRGDVVGEEGILLSGDGGAELLIPEGALGESTAAFVGAVEPEALLENVTTVAGAEVDLAGRTLSQAGTLSLSSPADLGNDENLWAAQELIVQGMRKLRLLGPAKLIAGRLVVEGVEREGRYFVFRTPEPLKVVTGTVSEGPGPSKFAVVESSTAPFMDVTGDDGAYRVGAAFKETTLQARSLLSGNVGSVELPPSTTTADIVLNVSGPSVISVNPPKDARGVSLAPSISLSFSEPVSPSTVNASSLRLLQAGTPVEGRITLGTGNRSASFLPSANLDPRTEYKLVATAVITDVSGNGLLPFESVFTTLDDTPAGFHPEQVVVSFPDENGEVTISAPAGSFEDSASVLIINNSNAVVTTGSVNLDGSFSFKLRATVSDEIQIRITDSSGRGTVIDKTEFHASDGRVAIGKRGGKVEADGFVLEVPEGAIPKGAGVFRLTAMSAEKLAELPVPADGGHKGTAVEIETGGVVLEKEAKLALPTPADAPESADFLVVRKVEENGVILYEVVDSATVKDGKVKSESFPFLGVLGAGAYLSMWFDAPAPGRSPMGVITGIAQETDSNPVAPQRVALAGVSVRAVKDLGGSGDYTATTGANGRFVLVDGRFGSGGISVNLVATDPQGREVRAAAFEAPRIFSDFPNLARYNKAGDVVFNFALRPPQPPPGPVSVKLFRKNESGREVEITNGVAALGEELLIRIGFEDSPSQVSLEGLSEVLEKVDPKNYLVRFRPTEARSYTVTIKAIDAFLNQIEVKKSFLAVEAGGGNEKPLPGPPSVITDSAVPRPGEKGVSLNQLLSVRFTEPVKGISPSSVVLAEKGGASVPVKFIGVGDITRETVLAALTIQPVGGLKFGTEYELKLTGAIEDTDSPTPERLTPDPTVVDFSTFTPETLSEVEVAQTRGMTVLGSRAFVGLHPGFHHGTLRTFDLSDPAEPRQVGEDTLYFGLFYEADAEAGVELGSGEMVGVLSQNVRPAQAILTLFDVGGEPPYPWLGAVTVSQPPEQAALGQLDLFKGFAYLAAGAAGVKVVDLTTAAESYKAAKAGQPGGDPPFEVSRVLNTPGLGFGQEAVFATIPVEVEGQKIRMYGAQAKESAQGRVVFAAGEGGNFATVDVVQNVVLRTIRLQKENQALGYGWRIALTRIGDLELALVIGGSGEHGQLAVVDVTNPGEPVVLSVTELQGTSARDLAIDEDGTTVFISTPEGVEIYNLSNPEAPQFAGTITGLGTALGDLAIAQGTLVAAGTDVGLRIAALRNTTFVRQITPAVFPLVDGKNDEPIVVDVGIVPADFEVQTSELELLANDMPVVTLPVTFNSPGRAILPPGFQFNPDVRYEARSVVNRGVAGKELVSQKKALRPAQVEFIETKEVDDQGPLDVLKVFDPRPTVIIDTLKAEQPSGDLTAGALSSYTVTGRVLDDLAPVKSALIDGKEFTVTQQSAGPDGLGPFVGSFSAEQFYYGRQDAVVTVTAKNALNNVGWDGAWLRLNPTASGEPGRPTAQHLESVPIFGTQFASEFRFRLQVKDPGLTIPEWILVRVQTGIEENFVRLDRQGSVFRSRPLYLVPEHFSLPTGLSKDQERDLSETRIRGRLGSRIRVTYLTEAIKDEAIASGVVLVDDEGRLLKFVAGMVATPEVKVTDIQVDDENRMAHVTGTVFDPLAQALSGSPEPKVTVNGTSAGLTAQGAGQFAFEAEIRLFGLEVHVQARAENLTGAFASDGRLVTLTEDDNLRVIGHDVEAPRPARLGGSLKPFRVKVYGPKLDPAVIMGTLGGVYSHTFEAEGDRPQRVGVTFGEEKGEGRGGLHVYLSKEKVVAAKIPSHELTPPKTPAGLSEARTLPAEVGGFVQTFVDGGPAGPLSGLTDVSGFEILVPREGSIVNVTQAFTTDQKQPFFGLTVKWRGIPSTPTMVVFQPGLLAQNEEPALVNVSTGLQKASRESIAINTLAPGGFEENVFIGAATDDSNRVFRDEAGLFAFTEDMVANETPIEESTLDDATGMAIGGWRFLTPTVHDGFDFFYPQGSSDPEISEHLRKNGLRPFTIKRNAGTLVTAYRADGKDALTEGIVEEFRGARLPPAAGPRALPEQLVDGDEITWEELVESGFEDQWFETYRTRPPIEPKYFAIAERSLVLQRVRDKLGLPQRKPGRSAELQGYWNAWRREITQDVLIAAIPNPLGFFAVGGGVVTKAGFKAVTIVEPKVLPAVTFRLTEAALAEGERLGFAQVYRSGQLVFRNGYLKKEIQTTGYNLMVDTSAKLGLWGLEQVAFSPSGLGLSGFTCCDGPISGGGAKGVFDKVAEKDGRIIILEAKGGIGWFSPQARRAGRIVTDPLTKAERYYLQGTREYILDVARAMTNPSNPPNVIAAGDRILDKIAADAWDEIDYYFVASRWSVRSEIKFFGPIGKGLVRRLGRVVRVTKSVL